jgi:hypothetical protein
MPDPVIPRRRASCGYTGRGAYSTDAFIVPSRAAVPLTKDTNGVFDRGRAGRGGRVSSGNASSPGGNCSGGGSGGDS